MEDFLLKVEEATLKIKDKVSSLPKIGIVLGSGLGMLVDEFEEKCFIDYASIPHFPTTTVVGHSGKFVLGEIEQQPVIAMQGRFHLYEGYKPMDVTLPIYVMKELGVEKLIVTNAAGGINKLFNVGDFMLIEDHINLMGINPLVGVNFENLGERFVDMSNTYSKDLKRIALDTAKDLNINLHKGVYVGVLGPSYETPAEIRMLKIIGGDAVGMSTIPEVIVARYAQMEVLGISCITNMAAGILEKPLSHKEVMETANRVKPQFCSFIKSILSSLKKHDDMKV